MAKVLISLVSKIFDIICRRSCSAHSMYTVSRQGKTIKKYIAPHKFHTIKTSWFIYTSKWRKEDRRAGLWRQYEYPSTRREYMFGFMYVVSLEVYVDPYPFVSHTLRADNKNFLDVYERERADTLEEDLQPSSSTHVLRLSWIIKETCSLN